MKYKILTVRKKLNHCNALHCTACQNKENSVEQDETEPEGMSRRGPGLSAMWRQVVTSWERYTASRFLNWELASCKMEENCIDKLCPGGSWARPLAMFLSHQGNLSQSESSLCLSVDGSSHWPSCPGAKYWGRIPIKVLMRKALLNETNKYL